MKCASCRGGKESKGSNIKQLFTNKNKIVLFFQRFRDGKLYLNLTDLNCLKSTEVWIIRAAELHMTFTCQVRTNVGIKRSGTIIPEVESRTNQQPFDDKMSVIVCNMK